MSDEKARKIYLLVIYFSGFTPDRRANNRRAVYCVVGIQ